MFNASILIMVFTTLFLGLGLDGSSSVLGAPPPRTSKIVIEPESYDFGTISMAKGMVSAAFTIWNRGEAPFRIKAVKTS